MRIWDFGHICQTSLRPRNTIPKHSTKPRKYGKTINKIIRAFHRRILGVHLKFILILKTLPMTSTPQQQPPHQKIAIQTLIKHII